MHAGFIFLADSNHALIVGFCVRLTAQSVGLQLWGSAGSWSANIVSHCKDSSDGVSGCSVVPRAGEPKACLDALEGPCQLG